MTHSTDSTDNPTITSLTDDEMLDILRRVQSGELSVEQAEQLLGAASREREEHRLGGDSLDSQDFSAPLGKTANGKLVFERGVAGLVLRSEQLPGQLFTARFERHIPVVRVNGGTVTVRYRDFGFGLLNWLRYGFSPPRAEVIVNSNIPWQLDTYSGIVQSRLDLQAVKLRGMTIHSGASDIQLMLGAPNGVVKLTFHGGVNNITLLRPATAAVRLTIHGSAANLALDDQRFGAVSGVATLETPNSQDATPHYAITVHGGANNFKVAAL